MNGIQQHTATALLAGVLLLGGCAGQGPDAAEPIPGNNLAAASAPGALLAASCSGCHGTTDTADPDLPDLKTLSAAKVRTNLLAFRDGSRQGTLMNRIASGYSPAEINLLADHLGRP